MVYIFIVSAHVIYVELYVGCGMQNLLVVCLIYTCDVCARVLYVYVYMMYVVGVCGVCGICEQCVCFLSGFQYSTSGYFRFHLNNFMQTGVFF